MCVGDAPIFSVFNTLLTANNIWRILLGILSDGNNFLYIYIKGSKVLS